VKGIADASHTDVLKLIGVAWQSCGISYITPEGLPIASCIAEGVQQRTS
jgi:hypothetical protein